MGRTSAITLFSGISDAEGDGPRRYGRYLPKSIHTSHLLCRMDLMTVGVSGRIGSDIESAAESVYLVSVSLGELDLVATSAMDFASVFHV